MDAVNRVKLARYWQRRGLMMLQCLGADRGGPGFGQLARNCFDAARECVRLARVELGMVKLRGWWVTECGNRSVLVYAHDADGAVKVAQDSGDWYGDAQDIALLETSVRPMAHIEPSVIAWASDLEFVL